MRETLPPLIAFFQPAHTIARYMNGTVRSPAPYKTVTSDFAPVQRKILSFEFTLSPLVPGSAFICSRVPGENIACCWRDVGIHKIAAAAVVSMAVRTTPPRFQLVGPSVSLWAWQWQAQARLRRLTTGCVLVVVASWAEQVRAIYVKLSWPKARLKVKVFR